MAGEPLDAREVTFGAVTFHIGKMLPMESKRVFMGHVRPLLGGALKADTGMEGAKGPEKSKGDEWKLLLAAFTEAPQEHYDAIVRALYGQITYTSPDVKQQTRLLGDEENAFKDLDMAHSVMLDARSFYVNFFPSFGVVMSEFPFLARAFQSLAHPT